MGLIGPALNLRPELPSRPAPSYPLLELCTGLPDSCPPSRVAHTLPLPLKEPALESYNTNQVVSSLLKKLQNFSAQSEVQ